MKNFFSRKESIYNALRKDSYVRSTLIHIAEAFSRITYKSIFLLDYYRQEFLYVSSNHLRSEIKSNLINQQITPISLADEGKIGVVMCVVSLSSHKTIGHAEFHKKEFENYWEYSFEKHRWEERKGISLKEEEVEVLKLSATGLTMAEIAKKMCRSLDTIKF